MTEHFDLVILGSGAGGGTLARALAPTGARIRRVERGEAVPREADNWNPAAVWRDLRYRTRETWVDGAGAEFLPYTHYCVGGNTKFWGSVLYRLRREDFGEVQHADGVSPAWPIDYDTLAPRILDGALGDVLARTRRKLEEATDTLDAAQTRTRAMARRLKDVEALPEARAQALLPAAAGGPDAAAGEDDEPDRP